MAAFDIKKFSTLDRVIAGAGVVALISLFLPWYGFSGSSGVTGFSYSASVSGFSTGYGWLGALLIIAAAVWLVLQRSAVDLSKIKAGNVKLTPAVLILGASALGTLLVIIRWLALPKGSYGVSGTGFSYGPRIGMYLAIIAGIVEVVGAVMLFRASGEALPWAGNGSPAVEPPESPSL